MSTQAEQIVAGLGGAANILDMEPCITRAAYRGPGRVLVDEKVLKAADALVGPGLAIDPLSVGRATPSLR